MTLFEGKEGYSVVCQSQGTRYGFRHVATLLKNGYEVGSAKCCYYNRTWEAYQFDTVRSKLAEKYPEAKGIGRQD